MFQGLPIVQISRDTKSAELAEHITAICHLEAHAPTPP
jgi:hypothetical protein